MSPSPTLTGLSPETAYRLGLLRARYDLASEPVKTSFHLCLLAYGWRQFSTQFQLFDQSGDPASLTRTYALPERRFFCSLVAELVDERVAQWARRLVNISRSDQPVMFDIAASRDMVAQAQLTLQDCRGDSPIERVLAYCVRLKDLPAFAEPLHDFRIDDPGGPLPYHLRQHYGGAWAAAIALASADLGFDLLGGLPLFGIVQRQFFRLDFATERAQGFVEANLSRAVGDALAALRSIEAGIGVFDRRLRASGRRSAVFEIWMALQAVGELSPAQVYGLLDHSSSNAFRAIQRLHRHAMIRLRGDPFFELAPLEPIGIPSPTPLGAFDFGAIDATLSDIGSLLARRRR